MHLSLRGPLRAETTDLPEAGGQQSDARPPSRPGRLSAGLGYMKAHFSSAVNDSIARLLLEVSTASECPPIDGEVNVQHWIDRVVNSPAGQATAKKFPGFQAELEAHLKSSEGVKVTVQHLDRYAGITHRIRGQHRLTPDDGHANLARLSVYDTQPGTAWAAFYDELMVRRLTQPPDARRAYVLIARGGLESVPLTNREAVIALAHQPPEHLERPAALGQGTKYKFALVGVIGHYFQSLTGAPAELLETVYLKRDKSRAHQSLGGSAEKVFALQELLDASPDPRLVQLLALSLLNDYAYEARWRLEKTIAVICNKTDGQGKKVSETGLFQAAHLDGDDPHAKYLQTCLALADNINAYIFPALESFLSGAALKPEELGYFLLAFSQNISSEHATLVQLFPDATATRAFTTNVIRKNFELALAGDIDQVLECNYLLHLALPGYNEPSMPFLERAGLPVKKLAEIPLAVRKKARELLIEKGIEIPEAPFSETLPASDGKICALWVQELESYVRDEESSFLNRLKPMLDQLCEAAGITLEE